VSQIVTGATGNMGNAQTGDIGNGPQAAMKPSSGCAAWMRPRSSLQK
jgi:hypothetical protein